MTWNNTTHRYGSVSIGLHWFTLALLIKVYGCINLIKLYPKGSAPREALKGWHFMLGLTVLALVAGRLLNRLFGRTPEAFPPLPQWQDQLAGLIHGALYAFMVAMPLPGWLTLSPAGKPIPFFGLDLPTLLAPDKNLAESPQEVHETVGSLGYFLIGAHTLATLFHHFVTRDNTLVRMLPGRR